MALKIPPAGELKRIRESLGLTQSQLAAAIGFGPNGERTVWQWENDDGFKPTGLAWSAVRYLAGLADAHRAAKGANMPLLAARIREMLPEAMR